MSLDTVTVYTTTTGEYESWHSVYTTATDGYES